MANFHGVGMQGIGFHYLRLILAAMTLVGWGVFVWAMLVFHHARPEMKTLLTRLYELDLRTWWLMPERLQLWWLLVFCCLVSLASLLLNRYLVVHRQGRYLFSLLLLLSVSLACLLVLYFGLPIGQ